ncbi:Uncharacterised protein [uncultured archaeon]|nr:Uncharacterised protein [uncultured archaeon]
MNESHFSIAVACFALLFFAGCINTGGVLSGAQQPQANSFKVGGEAGNLPSSVSIAVSEPAEFDGLSKAAVYDLRKSAVNRHAQLLEGNYSPSESVFGQIADARPWIGIEGQFCNAGNIARITEGASEESRFVLNPFLLLGADEMYSYGPVEPCVPAYPHLVALTYYPFQPRAVARYDLSRLVQEKEEAGLTRQGLFDPSRIQLRLWTMNARDFGYSYVYADPAWSSGAVSIPEKGRVFEDACEMKNFVHNGGSCGISGGCNNGSPDQPELTIEVRNLPATVYFRLWK